MALEVIHRAASGLAGNPSRVAVLPGAWNPPTVAHLEMARSALSHVDEVLWVLPRAFPHKSFEGPGLADRCRMLKLVTSSESGFSAAVSDGGLYVDIAAEAAGFYGSETELAIICGRDAAERIEAWDYGRAGVFEEMIRRHRLLVAARAGEYAPAPGHADRIACLHLAPAAEGVSSSEVRRRIAAGLEWEHLVPTPIHDVVRRLYRLD